MRFVRPVQPGPGQESVWDYPRPPRVESTSDRVRIILADLVLADSCAAHRVLEQSHPPVYYIPPADIDTDLLVPVGKRSFCEWKGEAHYYTILAPGKTVPYGAWFYPDPTPAFAAIEGHVAFYPGKMDACYLGDERVLAQPGDFYGGWITSRVVGPFKGGPGTMGW